MAEAAPAPRELRALLVEGGEGPALVLPAAMVAEVASWTEPAPIAGAPGWILGRVPWRGISVPVAHLAPTPTTPATGAAHERRLLFLYALTGREDLRCFALACPGVPRPVAVTADRLAPDPGAATPAPLAHAARLDGESVWIPDADALEAALADASASPPEVAP